MIAGRGEVLLGVTVNSQALDVLWRAERDRSAGVADDAVSSEIIERMLRRINGSIRGGDSDALRSIVKDCFTIVVSGTVMMIGSSCSWATTFTAAKTTNKNNIIFFISLYKVKIGRKGTTFFWIMQEKSKLFPKPEKILLKKTGQIENKIITRYDPLPDVLA